MENPVKMFSVDGCTAVSIFELVNAYRAEMVEYAGGDLVEAEKAVIIRMHRLGALRVGDSMGEGLNEATILRVEDAEWRGRDGIHSLIFHGRSNCLRRNGDDIEYLPVNGKVWCLYAKGLAPEFPQLQSV
jgi:hypothetical protein